MCTALDSPYEPSTAGTDMTASFLSLFLWGFIIVLMPLTGTLITILGAATKMLALASVGGICILCSAPAHLIWVIIVACKAWSSNALIAAGDNMAELTDYLVLNPDYATSTIFMPASQNFLSVWAWIFVIMYSLSCLCCIVAFFAAKDKLMMMVEAAKGGQ